MVTAAPAATSRTSRRIHVTDTRSAWQRLDWVLIVVTVALLTLGTLLVWSATRGDTELTGGDPTAIVAQHVLNIAIGAVLALVVTVTDHRWVRIWVPVVYAGSVVGLVAVLTPLGETINGSRSWIRVAGLSLQPSELAKVGVVVGIALVLAEKVETKRRRDALKDTDVLLALLIAGVPCLLILAQPDLGTLLVLGATVFGLLAVGGAPKRWLFGLVAAAAAGAFAVVRAGLLEGYQLERFQAFLHPSADPLGAGYNTIQARIAIGNGGLFGQGLFHGSQTQSGFVPEQHTDFIFTVAGEELGLVGAGAIVVLFLALLWRAARIASLADDMFGRAAGAGIVCWFGFQAFQSIGMCLGIMPVTGVPLPLVSYGGTSMFATLTAIGLLLNIGLRNPTIRPITVPEKRRPNVGVRRCVR